MEKKMLQLPPALTLGMQAVFGVLAGPLGVTLSTPIVAAGMVIVRML